MRGERFSFLLYVFEYRISCRVSSYGSLSMLVGLLTRSFDYLLTLRGFPNSSNLVVFVCL